MDKTRAVHDEDDGRRIDKLEKRKCEKICSIISRELRRSDPFMHIRRTHGEQNLFEGREGTRTYGRKRSTRLGGITLQQYRKQMRL